MQESLEVARVRNTCHSTPHLFYCLLLLYPVLSSPSSTSMHLPIYHLSLNTWKSITTIGPQHLSFHALLLTSSTPPHHITSHHITSPHHITSHNIASCCIAFQHHIPFATMDLSAAFRAMCVEYSRGCPSVHLNHNISRGDEGDSDRALSYHEFIAAAMMNR